MISWIDDVRETRDYLVRVLEREFDGRLSPLTRDPPRLDRVPIAGRHWLALPDAPADDAPREEHARYERLTTIFIAYAAAVHAIEAYERLVAALGPEHAATLNTLVHELCTHGAYRHALFSQEARQEMLSERNRKNAAKPRGGALSAQERAVVVAARDRLHAAELSVSAASRRVAKMLATGSLNGVARRVEVSPDTIRLMGRRG